MAVESVREVLADAARTALRGAVAPVLLVALALWAAMSGDPALPWYVAAAALVVYAAIFLFLAAVGLAARNRPPEPTRFGPHRFGAVAILLAVSLVALVLTLLFR